MLNKVKISNYKSHRMTELDLNKLTLLVGTNSSGKSSVIQSLLLVIHNVTNQNASPLNGHLISVGNFNEASNYITNADFFNITLCQDDQQISLDFKAADDSGVEAGITYQTTSEALKEYLNYINNNIHYLSANRIGGQDLYSKNFDKYDVFGLHGEYAMDYFQLHKKDVLDDNLILNQDSKTLETQVDFWLDKIFGQKLITTSIIGTDKIKAEYKLPFGRNIRPKNTGSGISYLVSIIIICLSSKIGDVIIIENPEIHLHPKAQAHLTEFLIFIANADRQLIIETHSDHIFNGIRVGLSKDKISNTSVDVHFFSLDDEFITNSTKICINPAGKIENIIPDLFDQFSNDLKALVGF